MQKNWEIQKEFSDFYLYTLFSVGFFTFFLFFFPTPKSTSLWHSLRFLAKQNIWASPLPCLFSWVSFPFMSWVCGETCALTVEPVQWWWTLVTVWTVQCRLEVQWGSKSTGVDPGATKHGLYWIKFCVIVTKVKSRGWQYCSFDASSANLFGFWKSRSPKHLDSQQQQMLVTNVFTDAAQSKTSYNSFGEVGQLEV